MKNFKTSNIQYADEGSAPPLAPVQRLVDTLHNPLEHALIDGLGDGLDRELNLLPVLRLGHEVAAHLQLGLEQGAREVRHVEAEEVADLLGHRVVGQGGLVVGALLLEGEVAHLEDARHGLDYRDDVLVAHAHDVHGLYRVVVLFDLVDARDGHVRVGQVAVGLHVVEQILDAVLGRGAAQQLVENVEGALIFCLSDGAGFLEQVCEAKSK